MRLRRPGHLRSSHALFLIGSLLAITWGGPAFATEPPAPQARVVEWEDLEIPVTVYPAAGDRVLLWLPSEYGFQQSHETLALGLAQRGIESWIADLYSAHFLPVGPSAVEAFSAQTVTALIQAAHEATGKEVLLAGHDRGAIPALEGARSWQLAHPETRAWAAPSSSAPTCLKAPRSRGNPPSTGISQRPPTCPCI